MATKRSENLKKRAASEHHSAIQNRSAGVVLKKTELSQSEISVELRQKRSTFNHAIYEKAAQIFLHLKGQIPATELPTFQDDFERRRAYSLAFGAKRYEIILEDVLLDSYFFSSFFKLEAYHKHRVYVILLDYQQNGFFFGSQQLKNSVNEDDIIPHIKEIQDACIAHRTKLRASLARSRIRDCALSVEALLPEEEQEKIKCAAQQPVYGRVNILKTTMEVVIDTLKAEGFLLLQDELLGSESELTGRNVLMDKDFENLLVFSPEIKLQLYNHELVTSGSLIIQDKSTYATAEVVKSFVNETEAAKEKTLMLVPGADVKAVLGDGSDIIQTHVGSGYLTSHLASVINPNKKIFAFDVTGESYEHLEEKMITLNATNVELMEQSFLDTNPSDDQFKQVKIIVVNVPCSKSGVVNPVDFVLQEGVSGPIKDLARGNLDNAKVKGLAFQHLSFLKHAMKFPLVQAIIYTTRSCHDAENIEVVKKALEDFKEEQGKGKGYFELNPTLPFFAKSLVEHAQSVNGASNGSVPLSTVGLQPAEKYLSIEPSGAMNGGFVAFIKKEKPVETAQEVLERAAKKGLMKPKTKTRVTSPKPKPGPRAHTPHTKAVKAQPRPPSPDKIISDTELDLAVRNIGNLGAPKKHLSVEKLTVEKEERKGTGKEKEKAKESHVRQFKF